MRADVQNALSRVVCGCEMIEIIGEVRRWDSDRRLAQMESMRSRSGVSKARSERGSTT